MRLPLEFIIYMVLLVLYHLGFLQCYYGSVIDNEVKTKKEGKQSSD